MTWGTIVPYIFQNGFPLAEKLLDKWLNHPNDAPTSQEWEDLKALARKNARSQMLDSFSRAGIDPNSPQAVALLAQVPE